MSDTDLANPEFDPNNPTTGDAMGAGDGFPPGGMNAADLESVFDVPVRVSAILGQTKIPVADLLRLDEGVVLELDRKVGESIDLYVNNRLVARGEVVMVEDKLGVTMTEIVDGQ